MKNCLVCFQVAPDDALTCLNCGEGSWGAVTETKPTADDAPGAADEPPVPPVPPAEETPATAQPDEPPVPTPSQQAPVTTVVRKVKR